MDSQNQLQLIVKTSGLEQTKAQYILEKFTNYFEIAAEWEAKAKTIVVRNDSDVSNMQLARVGRLFLREKRIAIEKARVELKEQALREGKAIDGIANILKGLIEPIEEYLDQQERYVEIKVRAEAARIQAEEAAKLEADRLAKEEADRKEQERIRLENLKLKEEAEAREKKIAQQKALAEKQQREAEAEKKKLEEASLKQQKEAEAKLKAQEEAAKAKEEAVRKQHETELARQKELEEQAKKQQAEAEEKLKAKVEEARIAKIKATQQQRAKEEAQAKLANLVECPFCHKTFTLKHE
jgi:hypothetical protein